MNKFKRIQELAEKRKGGAEQLASLLTPPKTVRQLSKISDDRYLAQMTRCIFNAGFHWRVITQKWPGFEEAFHRFDLEKLLVKSPDEWESYLQDERIVRNWQKIQTIFTNAVMVDEISADNSGFGKFIANWPVTDQVGLMLLLKKQGARLGGATCQYFLRFIGKDSFIISNDVVAALNANGVEIDKKPTSQRDLKLVQNAFNQWHEETGLPITHISKILSYSAGDNNSVDVIKGYQGSQDVIN